MNNFRHILNPILIFYKAQYRLQSREKIGFLLSFVTPMLYSAVFSYQIIVNFSLRDNPFINLPIWDYFTVFFALQTVHFLAFDQSLRQLLADILSGKYDYHLMRPISLWYFKYTRAPSLVGMFQTLLYFTCMLCSMYFAKLSASQVFAVLLFIVFASFIWLNIKATLRGLVFFKRDILSTTMLEESVAYFSINKPPEIFPQLIIALGSAVLPIFIVHNNLFDLIRGLNVFSIIAWFGWWVLLSLFLNRLVWKVGSRKYESG